jgi:hypothetical protein
MLKSLQHYEDRQCQMSDAEVTTTAIIAMLYFKGNFSLASRYLFEQNYFPKMLGPVVSTGDCTGLPICF